MKLRHDIEMTTGTGSTDIVVSLSYETDSDGIYYETVESITCDGVDVTGIFSEEQFADIEMQAYKKLQEHYEAEVDYEP